MAKVSIRKDDYERVMEIAARAAKRSNSVVVVAKDRVEVQEPDDASRPVPHSDNATVKFT